MDVEADSCKWYLLRIANNEFAIQYDGPNPRTEFPATWNGTSPQTEANPR